MNAIFLYTSALWLFSTSPLHIVNLCGKPEKNAPAQHSFTKKTYVVSHGERKRLSHHLTGQRRKSPSITDESLCRKLELILPKAKPESVAKMFGRTPCINTVADIGDRINILGVNTKFHGPWGMSDRIEKATQIVAWFSSMKPFVVYGIFWNRAGKAELFSTEILLF